MLDRGMRWDYPAIAGVKADLLLVTHEHLDHNGVEAGDGHAALDRRAPRVAALVVLGVASEHDEVAGTERGANTLFVSTLAGRRVTHLGDLGQRALRDEQLSALGTVDLLFVPVGGGPTIGAQQATEIGAAVGAIVPMHYKTTRIDFFRRVFGEVTVRRLAYRRRGQENLYLADGVLNPPAERASHGVRRLAAIESSRGSFDDGTDQVPRTDRAFDR